MNGRINTAYCRDDSNSVIPATARAFIYRSRYRGITLIYMLIGFSVLCGLCSLGVDLGHAQLVKTELRKVADATAHDYMMLYNSGGTSYANTNGPSTYSSSENPVDGGTVAPTITVTWGYWKSSTQSFSTTNNGGTVAVKVTASRTAANGNPVPIMLGSLLGVRGMDVTVSSTAALTAPQSTSFSIPSTSNPYYAGMPAGTTNAWGDTTTANAPIQITAIPVTPGTYLTFTNLTGSVSVVPGTMPYAGPSGVSGYPYGTQTHHGENWDGTGSDYSENGIADAVMPESSVMGLFLGSTEPDLNAAPATVDWTTTAMLAQSDFNNIQLQQPFYIGDGKNTGNTVQKFLVPAGATRFYVGIWDGEQYNNNAGSMSGTMTLTSSIQIVQ